MTQDELKAQQIALEDESSTLGLKRYRESVARGEAETRPGMRLTHHAVTPLSTEIAIYRAQCRAGVAHRGATLYKFLDQFDSDLVAYITAKRVIGILSGQPPVQAVALLVAKTLEDTVNFDLLREENPRAYRQLQKRLAKTTHTHHRHVVMRRQQKFAGITMIKWGQSERLRLGTLLIEMMQRTSGLFEIRRVSAGKHDTPLRVMPTADTLRWLETEHARCELLAPVFLPMVFPPRPWTTPFNGGYLTKGLRFPLVKMASNNYLSDLAATAEMPMVYEAVNAMQDTAWHINQPILRALREVWDGGGRIGGLPLREEEPLPMTNFTPAEAEAGADNFKAWKQETAKCHERNNRGRSKRIQLQAKLWLAERLESFESIYFPHALDFRGRAYAVASYITPQGDDVAKGLLEFAEAKPLGDTGAYWLAVHGSNTFGVDKVAFDERVQWVQENSAAIRDSADNPLDGKRFWCGADKPYQFLAFCFEWRNLHLWSNLGRTAETFESRLPVGMDGACNGLQNFSAMLRDEIGGAATNLVPSEVPSDIYAEVAAVANTRIAKDASGGLEIAKRWVGKVTRKLTKRNTMTVPYAVTEFGMRDQLMEEFKAIRFTAEETGVPCEDVIRDARMSDAAYLASVNNAAIGEVVVAARAAMDWLRGAASTVAKDGLPIRWVTPSGFVVLQDYRVMIGRRFDFEVAGTRFQLTLEVKGSKLDTRKQSSGISPNFVHALDAAHMQRTISYCRAAGVTSFAMIHDSYGTHAADVGTMFTELRRAFVDQYSGDVLGAFRQQLLDQVPAELGAKIAPVPASGSLDLEAVMQSDYFFA